MKEAGVEHEHPATRLARIIADRGYLKKFIDEAAEDSEIVIFEFKSSNLRDFEFLSSDASQDMIFAERMHTLMSAAQRRFLDDMLGLASIVKCEHVIEEDDEGDDGDTVVIDGCGE